MKIIQVHNYYRTRAGECSVVDSERALLEAHGEQVIPYYSDSCDIEKLGVVDKARMLINVPYNKAVGRDLECLLRAESPDIAHVHNVFPMLTPAVYKTLKDLGIPVVQTIHNVRFLCPNGQFYVRNHICKACQEKGYISAIKNRCLQDSYLVSAAYATAISRAWKTGILPNTIDIYIALNQFYAELLISAGVPSSRIRVLGNFISSNDHEVSKKLGYVLYLGRLTKEKGVITLLKALESLDGVTLKIAGSGPLEGEIRRAAIRLGKSRIQFLGHVTGQYKQELLRGATCLVVPSEWYENFPISVVEAMSLGTPVVASDIGGLPDMVKHQDTGLIFESGNPAAIAEALRNITTNGDFADHLAKNALRSARELFGSRKHYNGLMEIYASAINQKNTQFLSVNITTV